MRHYNVEGSVYRLTVIQENKFQKLFPDESRIDYDDNQRREADDWIKKEGKYLFHIYYI